MMMTTMTTVNAAVFGLCHNVVSSCHANLVDVRDIYLMVGWLVAGNLGVLLREENFWLSFYSSNSTESCMMQSEHIFETTDRFHSFTNIHQQTTKQVGIFFGWSNGVHKLMYFNQYIYTLM